MDNSGWHLISIGIAAVCALSNSLFMFVLNGMRSDLRANSEAIGDLRETVGKIKGKLDIE